MRTGPVILAAVLAAATVGFGAGFWAGSDGSPIQPAARRADLRDDRTRGSGVDVFTRLAADGAWGDLLNHLEALQHTELQAFARERLRLFDLAEQLAARGEQPDALELLSSYVSLNPGDAKAQFLLSDLYQMSGRAEDALEPLFAILDFPPDQGSRDRARRRGQLLINAMVQQLVNVGDIVALVDLYRSLVLREPGYDKHRLGLVRWLVRAGRYEAAASQLKELGNVGVSDDDVDAVRGELALAQSALPVARQGHMLYTELHIAGTPVRMLVDTGASWTGLRTDVLRRVGAIDLGRSVQVRTAGGLVTARVHRVQNLVLGEMRLSQLEVLALDTLPSGVEGLLGMDVLGAYPRLDL